MSEQEKDNQVAVSSLFTAAMIGGISAGGILGGKTCWSLPPVPKQVLFFYLFFTHQVWVKSILL
jgi:hypothetical protein